MLFIRKLFLEWVLPIGFGFIAGQSTVEVLFDGIEEGNWFKIILGSSFYILLIVLYIRIRMRMRLLRKEIERMLEK